MNMNMLDRNNWFNYHKFYDKICDEYNFQNFVEIGVWKGHSISYLAKKLKNREKFSHKGTYGHALIIAGSLGKMGASVLSTKAALRSGAGLVTAFVPKCGYEIIQITNPDIINLKDFENLISKKKNIAGFELISSWHNKNTDEKKYFKFYSLINEINLPLSIEVDYFFRKSKNSIYRFYNLIRYYKIC